MAEVDQLPSRDHAEALESRHTPLAAGSYASVASARRASSLALGRERPAADMSRRWEPRTPMRKSFSRRELRVADRPALGLHGIERPRRETSVLSLWQDVRFGIRTLVRSSAFSITSVATIALGIGATTAIVTVFDAVLLRPLPYPDADRLVVVWETIERADTERRSVSYPDYVDWRDGARSFGSLAAFSSESFTLGGDESVRVSGEAASAGYFSLLGRPLQLGRAFAPEEDRPDAAPVVIIGHDLWRNRFAGETHVVGREIRVDERTATVIGVAPAGFSGLSDEAQLWVPFSGPLTPRQGGFRENRATRWHQVVGRLATGVTPEDAQADLDVIAARLAHTFPDSNADRSVEVVPLREELFGQMRPALVALACAVAFLLLIACSNVANLLLARGASRRRELAVRAALGAGRGRLARQLITEAVCLALVGGVAGLVIAAWSLEVLGRISPLELPSWVSLSIDARALFGSFLVTLMTGVAIGVLPALGVAAADPQEGLRAGGRAGDAPRSARLRSGLVVAELAVALVLLVGAGLMFKSLGRLVRLETGFDASRLLALRTELPASRYSAEDVAALAPRLLEEVASLPGVESAALASDVPLDGSSSAVLVRIEGRSDATQEDGIRVYRHRISPGWFRTTGVTLLRGRDFDERDALLLPETGATIISQSMARRFWGDRDPRGAHLEYGRRRLEIIGVAADVKHRRLLEAAGGDPDIYLPMRQFPNRSFAVVARTSFDPESLLLGVRTELAALDAAVPVFDLRTFDDLLASETASARFTTFLLGTFSLVALLLAVVGIYGVMSYTVSMRTRELGTRMALGASAPDVLRLVLGESGRLIALATSLGVVAALALSRFLRSLLVEVEPTDPATYVVTALALATVAVVATLLPARRATRVDPIEALRIE